MPPFERLVFLAETLEFSFQLFVGHGLFLGCLAIKPKSIAAGLSLIPLPRPTNPNYLTDEELMAIAAGADRTNEAI
jgi:hypothetical protein